MPTEYQYYDNETVASSFPRDDQGRLHGMVRHWFINGQLSYETPFLHGQRHGVEKGWLFNGHLLYECYWIHGKKTTKNGYEASL